MTMQRGRMMIGELVLAAIALAVAVVTITSSGTAQPGGTAMSETDRLFDGEWVAESIKGSGVIDDAQSTIVIAKGGAISGSGGCNRLMGRAKVEGNQISFGAIATTRMACAPARMEQERKFLAALEETRAYRLDGARLSFHDASGSEVVRFIKR